MASSKEEFLQFVDSIINDTFHADEYQITIYNLDKHECLKSLQHQQDIPNKTILGGIGFAEGVAHSLECLSILASSFHIWEFYSKKIRTAKEKKRQIEENQMKEKMIEEIKDKWRNDLVSKGIKAKIANEIPEKFGQDLIQLIQIGIK